MRNKGLSVLGVRSKNDVTNRYRTDIRMQYLSRSDERKNSFQKTATS